MLKNKVIVDNTRKKGNGIKPAVQRITAENYDPDSMFSAIIPATETILYKRQKKFAEALSKKTAIIDARIYAVPKGKRLTEGQTIAIKGKGAAEKFKKLLESQEIKIGTKLKENADPFFFGIDSMAGISVGDSKSNFLNYTPLMGGPYSKQLYLYDYLLMMAEAFEAERRSKNSATAGGRRSWTH